MISRRQFFSIVLMFLTVFLLFQGLQVGKERWNEYQRNDHMEETGLRMDSAWTAEGRQGSPGEETSSGAVPPGLENRYVLFVGDRRSPRARVAQAWAGYTKRELRYTNSIPRAGGEDGPELVLIEGKWLAGGTEALEALLEAGVDLVCLDLPPVEAIVADDDLRSLLGIWGIPAPKIRLDGIHLFPGFLLGGERIYQAKTQEEMESFQDFSLETPWYVVRVGTKTFLQGILGEEDAAFAETAGMKNEDLPALIWRNHHSNGEVYAVNGDYMSNPMIGIGILDAVMAQRREYELYPVVNAQLISFFNFPEAADENRAEMERIYGRNQTDLERNILLPMFTALVNRYNYALTYCMAMQYDYEDDNAPLDGTIDYYLSNFNETGDEMGLSLLRRGDTPLAAKLEQDFAFARAQGGDYRFSSACIAAEELEELKEYRWSPLLDRVKTVMAGPVADRPIVGYLARNLTLQQITATAQRHTYTNDLELLGVETALGYSNTGFDMMETLWPRSEEDQWQNKSKDVFSNVATYGAPFAAFDTLTATKGDIRVRRFLHLDYGSERTEDTLRLFVEGFQGEAYFILRTHGEEIQAVEGGSWSEIEKDAWLIAASQPEVKILLERSPYGKDG